MDSIKSAMKQVKGTLVKHLIQELAGLTLRQSNKTGEAKKDSNADIQSWENVTKKKLRLNDDVKVIWIEKEYDTKNPKVEIIRTNILEINRDPNFEKKIAHSKEINQKDDDGCVILDRCSGNAHSTQTIKTSSNPSDYINKRLLGEDNLFQVLTAKTKKKLRKRNKNDRDPEITAISQEWVTI